MAETTPAVEAAPAAPPSPPRRDAHPVKVAKAPKVNQDGMVCHSEEVLGSHLPKRVCYTPAEAEDRSQQDRQALSHVQALSH